MPEDVILITGTGKGIGRYLAEYYLEKGMRVIGCSRSGTDLEHERYRHYDADVGNEEQVLKMVGSVSREYDRVDYLVNNAGIASMNHLLLTPLSTMEKVFRTNVFGTFLFCREVAKIMSRKRQGRIVNMVSVAGPLKLEGEAAYAASKTAIESLTEIMAYEIAPLGITCNAVGPTPITTDLIGGVPQDKIDRLIRRQAIHRLGEFRDVSNVVDFFIRPESDFITGQTVYLGGV